MVNGTQVRSILLTCFGCWPLREHKCYCNIVVVEREELQICLTDASPKPGAITDLDLVLLLKHPKLYVTYAFRSVRKLQQIKQRNFLDTKCIIHLLSLYVLFFKAQIVL